MTPLHRQVFWLLILACGCDISGVEKNQCHSDSECNPGRICVASLCRPTAMALGDAAVDAASGEPSGDDAAAPPPPTDGEPADQSTIGGAGGTCGDGTRQAGEACDDGNQIDDDACTNDCRVPGCGDGVAEGREECDDGNDGAADRCTPACTWVPFWQLAGGGSHMCGLRTNGMVTCWGSPEGPSTPLAGRFSAIAVGAFGSCALAEPGALTCWGKAATLTFPADTYDNVAVGDDFVCAATRTHELPCWGEAGSVVVRDQPGGLFNRVAAGGSSACAIDTDGRVHCWGGSSAINAGVPDGLFVDLAVGRFGACARDATGVTTCWGSGAKQTLELRSAFVGEAGICGVHESGLVTCWGNALYQAPVPPGRYTQVSGTEDLLCGVLASGAVSCWGRDGAAPDPSPTARPVRKIFAGYDGDVCGLDPLGLPRCPLFSGSLAWPQVPFEALALGPSSTALINSIRCGLHRDGRVECWGQNPLVDRVPPGSYRQVVVGEDFLCLLDGKEQVTCWGERSPMRSYGEIPVPAGNYRQLSAGVVHVCALTTAQTLACWSTDESWKDHPAPAGTYVQVASGRAASCAVGSDGRTLCWGPLAPEGFAPAGLHQVGTAGGRGYGLTDRGEIVVWGKDPPPRVPPGPFQSLVVGKGPCALRRNGEVVCFGGPVVNGDSPR
jgi:cysteine-rich repeat protein